MVVTYRWLRLFANLLIAVLVFFCAFNYQTSIYLLHQAKGQLSVLTKAEPLAEYEKTHTLSPLEKQNIELIEKIKAYSVDSLGYKPTNNFSKIYDQQGAALLWVVTACNPFSFDAYEWSFPIVGNVSYKGFFKKELAMKEFTNLSEHGYDVDLRSVSAWSSLGWFNDPILTNMIHRSKGSLCNLLFHELFHATYYAPSSVNFNENIASFIAHKATLQFLKSDTISLKDYTKNYSDNLLFDKYMLEKITFLKQYYKRIENDPKRAELKMHAIFGIADSLVNLPFNKPEKFINRKQEILEFKNAYLVDFLQYNSLQDSLEDVFNKIYKGKIEKLVQDLKLN